MALTLSASGSNTGTSTGTGVNSTTPTTGNGGGVGAFVGGVGSAVNSGVSQLTNQNNTTTPFVPEPLNVAVPNSPTITNPSALNTTPVNTTPSATDVSSSKSSVVPPDQTDTTQSSLKSTADSYMTQPSGTDKNSDGTVTTTPDASSSARDQALQTILNNTNTLSTEGQVQNDLNTQFGVDQKQQNYIDAYNQYQSKSVQYQHNIDNLYGQPGVSTEQANQAAQSISRVQNADLANLAIIAQTAQGNYQGSLDIVQRKLDVEFKPLQTQIDNLQGYLTANKDDLTTSQQDKIQSQIDIQKQNVGAAIDAKKQVYDTLIQYGAANQQNLSQLDQAQTLGDIYKVGASVTGNSNYGQDQSSSGSSTSFQTVNGGTVNATDSQRVAQLPQLYQNYVQAGPKGVAYIDSSRVPANQLQAVQTKAAQTGIPVLSGAEVSDTKSIENTYQAVDAMNKLANATLSSGLAGRIQGLTINQLMKNFQTGAPVTDPITGNQVPLGILLGQFDQYRTSAINAVKSLVGGTGSGLRITAGEIQTAAENLPTSADSLESAQTKIATFTKLLDNKLSGNFPSIAQSSSTNTSSSSSGGGSGWASLGG
jgi:hypothetical protein